MSNVLLIGEALGLESLSVPTATCYPGSDVSHIEPAMHMSPEFGTLVPTPSLVFRGVARHEQLCPWIGWS